MDGSTIAPLILKLVLDAVERWTWLPDRFMPKERASGNHWTVGARHRTGLANCDSLLYFVCFGGSSSQWAMACSFTRFLDRIQRRNTVGRTSLDEWSARRKDLYQTTYDTHNRQTSIPPVRIEPIISAFERAENSSGIRIFLSSVSVNYPSAYIAFSIHCWLFYCFLTMKNRSPDNR